MTLHSLSVPDDPTDLPRWLERQLLSPDFGGFIAELSAFFPATSATDPPRHLFDQWLKVALTDGLQPIPPDVLMQLLKHPQLLAALQEQIVVNGGTYWDAELERSDGLSDPLARGRSALERTLAAYVAASKGTDSPKAIHPASRRAGSRAANRGSGRTYKKWAVISTGVAASLAVAVGLLLVRWPGEPPIPKAEIAWGWAKPGGLAADQPKPKDYLNKLADNAEEWSIHRPTDAAGLGIRIAEFRIGCTRLIHSSYGPLAPADKLWMLEQCRAWGKALDGHLQALDGGTNALTVRTAVDETVRSIAAALREKAKQVK